MSPLKKWGIKLTTNESTRPRSDDMSHSNIGGEPGTSGGSNGGRERIDTCMGVTYCATCYVAFYREDPVAVFLSCLDSVFDSECVFRDRLCSRVGEE